MSSERNFFRLPLADEIASPTTCLLNTAGQITIPRPVRFRWNIEDGGLVNLHNLGSAFILTSDLEAPFYEDHGLPVQNRLAVPHSGLVTLPSSSLAEWYMKKNQTIFFADLLGPIAFYADALGAIAAGQTLLEMTKRPAQVLTTV